LIEQLKPGGTLVIPVGNAFSGQGLRVVTKDAQGQIEQRTALPVIFVPMIGEPPI
jgi:protein-L-isoaspartate(D-aspartate) O-methyltransferase